MSCHVCCLHHPCINLLSHGCLFWYLGVRGGQVIRVILHLEANDNLVTWCIYLYTLFLMYDGYGRLDRMFCLFSDFRWMCGLAFQVSFVLLSCWDWRSDVCVLDQTTVVQFCDVPLHIRQLPWWVTQHLDVSSPASLSMCCTWMPLSLLVCF